MFGTKGTTGSMTTKVTCESHIVSPNGCNADAVYKLSYFCCDDCATDEISVCIPCYEDYYEHEPLYWTVVENFVDPYPHPEDDILCFTEHGKFVWMCMNCTKKFQSEPELMAVSCRRFE